MDEPAEEMGLLFIFAYLVSIISGLFIFFTFAQRNARLKFHALQSILLGIIIIVIDYGLTFIPYISLIPLLLWFYGMYIGWKAYEGNDILIPIIGEYAKKYVTI